jgi:Tol biopolymer transport system component
MIDKANRGEVYVRPVDPNAAGGPWQVSDGSFSPAFWRRDGRELYYMARDQAIMVADVNTTPAFSFSKPKVLFRQEAKVPDRFRDVSADGERFLALPPPRGPQLQQLTVFNRQGEAVQKVGDPGLYAGPSFSPDGARLLVTKNDLQTGQQDLWTIDLATGKNTRLTNDTFPRVSPIWSPDGNYIYYSSFRNGDFPVHRRASDGSGDEELVFRYTPGAFVNVTDISADGKFLVCDSGGIILVVPLTGDPGSRKKIEFLREEFSDGIGRLSPDGRFMAFRSDEAEPERGEVYVRPIDAATMQPGEGKWRLSKDGVNAMLHWRADGKEVFFRGQNLESSDLLVVSVDVATAPTFTVGTPKVLFRLPGPLGGNLGNISRDGQRFVFAVNVPAAGTRRRPAPGFGARSLPPGGTRLGISRFCLCGKSGNPPQSSAISSQPPPGLCRKSAHFLTFFTWHGPCFDSWYREYRPREIFGTVARRRSHRRDRCARVRWADSCGLCGYAARLRESSHDYELLLR